MPRAMLPYLGTVPPSLYGDIHTWTRALDAGMLAVPGTGLPDPPTLP